MNWLIKISQADLSWILSGPSEDPRVGQETGEPVSDGISVYRDPNGSFRYVYYEHGQPIAGIQVVSDGERAIVANVYTSPEYQRGGLATMLFRRAQADFPDLQHSTHQEGQGTDWITSLGQKSMPLPVDVPLPERHRNLGVDHMDTKMTQETADQLREKYPEIEYGGAGAIGIAMRPHPGEMMKITHDWSEANAATQAYKNNWDWIVPVLEEPKMIQEDPPMWAIRMKELIPLKFREQRLVRLLSDKYNTDEWPRNNAEFEPILRLAEIGKDQMDEAMKIWAHMKYILDRNHSTLWLTDIHGGNLGWDDDGNLKIFDLGPGNFYE